MTLYDLIHKISNIITPETNAFYNYVLYTSDDDGGFLRTRYCWWDDPVPNHRIGSEYRTVLVTSQEPIEEADLKNESDTLAKIQLHYDYTDATLADAEWDAELGYGYVYLMNLEKMEYEMKYVEPFNDMPPVK